MKILLTGADGFLGWHLRCLAAATTRHEIIPVGRREWHRLTELATDVDAIIHAAGVNRAEETQLVSGNEGLALDVARAVDARAGSAPTVVFANSVQVGNGSAYAQGKGRAASVLRAATEGRGGGFADVLLPNLFGEHGRPAYNSFVATFIDAVVAGQSPQVEDRRISLLHAQSAAAGLLLAAESPGAAVNLPTVETSVLEVWQTLVRFHGLYPVTGDIPALANSFERDLFNSYRARLFPDHAPIVLAPRSDDRGRLVETVRTHGPGGQSFVSTTVPGVTRGEHYHLHKIERFVVLEGEAVIALRKMFTTEVVEFPVSGNQPVAIDMPTMWVHNITNVGRGTLTTLFWTDSLFDPDAPDTTPEPVRPAHEKESVR